MSLVGWSLGGIYAREIAKCCPDAVRQVITPGHAAPLDAGAPTTQARSSSSWAATPRKLTPEVEARLAQRPPVPTTSIYSEADGVVCWRGCLEEPGTGVENIAVDASHLGMPSHPDVLRIVAERLAQPERKLRRPRAVRPASAPASPQA